MEARSTAGVRLLLHSSTGALNPGAAVGHHVSHRPFSVRHPASALMSLHITFLMEIIGFR